MEIGWSKKGTEGIKSLSTPLLHGPGSTTPDYQAMHSQRLPALVVLGRSEALLSQQGKVPPTFIVSVEYVLAIQCIRPEQVLKGPIPLPQKFVALANAIQDEGIGMPVRSIQCIHEVLQGGHYVTGKKARVSK